MGVKMIKSSNDLSLLYLKAAPPKVSDIVISEFLIGKSFSFSAGKKGGKGWG